MDGSRQSPGFASKDSFHCPTTTTGLPSYPVTGCEFPRLQLRGSAGFPPASLPISSMRNARTKEVEKERKTTSRIRNQNQGSGIVTRPLRFLLLHRNVYRGRRDAVRNDLQLARAGLHIGRHVEIRRHDLVARGDAHGAVVVCTRVEHVLA